MGRGRAIGRRELLRSGVAGAGMLALGWGRLSDPAFAGVGPRSADGFAADVPTSWFELSLGLVQRTAGFSPPVAARAFAYAGVALFEAILPGIPGGRTLVGRLHDLSELPHAGHNAAYHWPTVANGALAAILRSLFPTATAGCLAAIDALEEDFNARAQTNVPPGVFRRSVDRGRDVAASVFEWSRTDGGHEAYANNFPSYDPPVGPGLWVPTPPAFLPALQPFWGSCRTFVSDSSAACGPGPPTPYSEDPVSPFFIDAFEVYETVNGLTPEQREIALFWSDDPGSTPTPPGHWVSILTQVLRQEGCSLDVAAEAYAKVGLAVADAFICCWFVKYRVNLLRPVTYIRALIDPGWMPILTTPPFPEFTSGHSVQSAASARVLTTLFGKVGFTDHTHDDAGLQPRSFGSFHEAAKEAAVSRLYGGIHFRPAIERGLEQGRCVGEHVASLALRG